LSLDNLIEKSTNVEMSDDIVTRLHLYGANELTVRDVNFGNTYIQNFDYFKNTKFMSQGLIDALDNYEALIDSRRATYNNYLSQLSTLNSTLITQESDLLILKGELQSLLEQRAYLQSINQSTSSLQVQINNKQSEVNTKQNQVNSTEVSINSVQNAIDSLIDLLDFESNFTQAQIEELDEFIIEDTYQDGSFLATDGMTYNEIVAVQNELLDAGIGVLARVSYPRYKIDIDVVNFLNLPEYASWWNELNLGDTLTVKVDDDYVVGIRITGYTDSEDNNKLSIQLGNRYQLDDANIDLLELIKSSLSAGTSINYKKYRFEDYAKNDKNEILSFINDSIDVLKNEIVSSSNVGIGIDSTGILAIGKDANGNVLPQQMRISNNAIVLTDDGFNTAKMAIGKLANGYYGVAAEVIAGKMILGNNMIIETGSGDFRVDGSGVNITKLSINMTSTDNLKNIIIDPSNGIKIRTRSATNQAFRDFMYFDSNSKDFIIDGRIIVRGGSGISNFSDAGNLATLDMITSTQITNSSITTPKIATGAVTADKITVNSLSAISANIGTVNAGTINGVTINGTTINGSIFNAGSQGRLQIKDIGGDGYINFSNYLNQQSFGLWYSSATSQMNLTTFNNTGLEIKTFSSFLNMSAGNMLFQSNTGYIYFNTTPTTNDGLLATRSWVNSQLSGIGGGGVQDVIGYGGIIASILGDTLFVSADDNQIVKSLSSQQITFQYLSANNSVEVRVNGTYRGAIFLV
jgi:hypothetical protein